MTDRPVVAEAADAQLGAGMPWASGPGQWSGPKRLIFPAVFLIYLGQTLGGIADHTTGTWFWVGVAVLVAFCACYIAALPARWAGRNRRFWVLYATMLVLFAIEVVFAHQDASVMLVYVAILGIATGARYSVLASIGLAVVAAVLPATIPAWHAGFDPLDGLIVALVSLSMWAFFGIIRANRALTEARAEVAGLAAENERNRIARDLHDLLGHSLTTITVKAALAKRLSATDPTRAAVEIGEVEELARRALTDVRAAVSNYHETTLAGELATGQEVLRAAGIEGRLLSPTDIVRPDLDELFGWVVREGVTNVVRHSRATTCTITLGPTSIELRDDGRAVPAASGNGLRGLSERVAAHHGTATSAPHPDGGWRLAVEVPATAVPARPAAHHVLGPAPSTGADDTAPARS